MLSKERKNLIALHRILTRVRSQAYLGLEAKKTGRILDDAEFILAQILSNETENLRQLLVEMEAKYEGFDGLVATYDAEPVDSSVASQPLSRVASSKI